MLSNVAGTEVSRNTLMVSMCHPYEVGPATAGLRADLGQPTEVQVTTGSTVQVVGWGGALPLHATRLDPTQS